MLLAQAAQSAAALDLRDLAQYIADAAMLGAFGFAWRTNSRVTRVEAILTERRTGLVDLVTNDRSTIDGHASELAGHQQRLDQHDRDIDRLDREKAPRPALQPTDVGILDRRGKP